MDLAIVHDDLVDEIQYGLLHVGTSAIGEMGYIFDELAEQFEALALCHLLRFADLEEYRRNLVRGGQARLYYLQRSQTAGNHCDRYLAIGRTRSFLDAVVAGDLSLARQIADFSINSWNSDWEYEDDFCFFVFLHVIVQSHPHFPPPKAVEILARFEQSLQGKRSNRFEVCRALIVRAASDFSDTLKNLLEEERALIENQQDSANVHEGNLAYWPSRFVSIEGLALLALAKLVGMYIESEFDRCPSIAQLSWAENSEPDLFIKLEQTP